MNDPSFEEAPWTSSTFNRGVISIPRMNAVADHDVLELTRLKYSIEKRNIVCAGQGFWLMT